MLYRYNGAAKAPFVHMNIEITCVGGECQLQCFENRIQYICSDLNAISDHEGIRCLYLHDLTIFDSKTSIHIIAHRN